MAGLEPREMVAQEQDDQVGGAGGKGEKDEQVGGAEKRLRNRVWGETARTEGQKGNLM